MAKFGTKTTGKIIDNSIERMYIKWIMKENLITTIC